MPIRRRCCKSMASLAEELSQLANPTPKFHDPEDDIHDETSARVVSSQIKADSDDDTQVEELTSKFRRQTLPLLSETDIKYQGKTTSRKSLLADDLSDEYEGPQGSDDESEESSEKEDNSSDEDVEVDISAFKQQIKLKSGAIQEKSMYLDDNNDDVSDETMEEGASDDSQSENSDGQHSEEDSGVEEDGANEDGVSKFTKTDFSEEIEKGKAVKNQITLWESLLEGRIKLQKSLSFVNQLPHPEQWPTFASEGGDDFTDASTECQQAVKTLLDSLLHLQTLLLLNNPETKSVAQGGDIEGSSLSKADDDVDNEEITSESEVEEDSPVKSGKSTPVSSGKPLKRKLKTDEYPDFMAKRHTDFQTYRNNTIQKWGEKTRLASGKLKNKSFSAFELSAVRQIEQIMTDKNRLIKRTQLKRSVYQVLGKEGSPEQGETTGENIEINQIDTTKQEDQNYDMEIFDDDDFYHQLLRELIERKTSDITDPVALSRQWLEIQRLRTKVKKKVDTKASKGRKLRYDIHKKLVNFTAPVDYSTWTDEARDDLYRSLFGKIFNQATTEGR